MPNNFQNKPAVKDVSLCLASCVSLKKIWKNDFLTDQTLAMLIGATDVSNVCENEGQPQSEPEKRCGGEAAGWIKLTNSVTLEL